MFDFSVELEEVGEVLRKVFKTYFKIRNRHFMGSLGEQFLTIEEFL